ncbi:MAG: translation initiation factor IF-2 [Actinomycetota bacterium]|nr:translation initiation factor IF-2 [Actinomycetota bacterium]MDH5223851.1 translation initiation factor IF-2 [Actinomycetota bacterium]
MRVHELAKELGVTSKELLVTLEQMGVSGKSASSSVPENLVPRLRASGGKATEAPKRREVLEPPPAPRKPKAAAKPKPKTKAAPAASPPKTVTTEETAAPSGTPEPEPAPATVPATAAPTASPAAPAVAPGAKRPPRVARTPAEPEVAILHVVRGATPQDIAEKVGTGPADIVKILFLANEMATATTSLSDAAIMLVADELGMEAEIVALEDELIAEEIDEFDEALLVPRPPVVTVMGHVDHGKTKLLDAIRETDVVAGEFGGITQHIGAYQAHVGDRDITFIDTPGHEAFTAMRARGAQVTDIAVLVVAADDGVMPQSIEALDHAKAAGVPVVVAVNKVDKEAADPTRVRQQLVERGLVPSEWGGDTEFVDVSAKARTNLDSLLETILLVADLEELKGIPSGRARGAVIEAHLDKGRGPVATVLVQRGTLDIGDALVSGTTYCKIRAMQDEYGNTVDVAGPSKPVQVLGWEAVPASGDEFREVADERAARHVADEREAKARAAQLVTSRPPTLSDLLRQAERAEIPELNLVVKADVQGSLGALTDAFLKLPQGEVRVNIVRSAAGGITENDVSLAMASQAIVIGFNVRPDKAAVDLSDREGVDIRTYRVIYDAIDDIKAALSGMLAPEKQEHELGQAEIRQTFRVPKLGVVAGCYVTQGSIPRDARVRLVRDGIIVYDGRIGSLRRFKDDVKEVASGYECGIGIEGYQDIKEGDVIEAYEVREVARSI